MVAGSTAYAARRHLFRVFSMDARRSLDSQPQGRGRQPGKRYRKARKPETLT